LNAVQLLDDVYLIGSGSGGFGITHPFDCNVYLVVGQGEAAIIDAGMGPATEAMVAAIATIVDVASVHHLILTHAHPDHSGGAWRWKELLPHIRIVSSPAVARMVREGDEHAMSLAMGKRAGFYPPDFRSTPCPVDGEVAEGETIRAGALELVVLETPGHADGHISLMCTSRGKDVLFCGDVVFFGGLISLANNWDCRIQDYAATMAKLASLEVDALFPGHHSVDLSSGARHIDAAHRRFDSGFVPKSIV
jgi:hydroxyacylglutathione hydrolase